MSKILKNVTGSTVFVNDTGVSIPASSQYTIAEQDYLLWGASSDVVTLIGDEDIIVNDGTFDLDISDGIDLIKGYFPRVLQTTTAGTVGNMFNNVSAVASASDTDIVTYTAVSGDKLLQADFGGTNIAKFDIEINGASASQFYTHFCNLNGSCSFSGGLGLLAGDIVKISVLHNRPNLGDFFGKILILGV